MGGTNQKVGGVRQKVGGTKEKWAWHNTFGNFGHAHFCLAAHVKKKCVHEILSRIYSLKKIGRIKKINIQKEYTRCKVLKYCE